LVVGQPNDSTCIQSTQESSDESGEESSEDDFNEISPYILGNIPIDVNEDELKQMFSGFGKIVEITVIRRERNHGRYFGFILFQNVTSAYNLLQSSWKRNFVYRGNDLKIDRVR
jgi:RNA recognition motif-containing protein